MKQNYALFALDTIFSSLHPTSSLQLGETETTKIIETISQEKVKVYNRLQKQLFKISEEEASRLLIQKYYNAVINLINRAYHLYNQASQEETGRLVILEYLSISLEELKQLIEVRYPLFLNQEERVPLPELVCMKVAMQEQLIILPDVLVSGNNSERVIQIVLDALTHFIDRIDQQDYITLKEAQYHREMMQDLLRPAPDARVLADCPTLHESLLYWNFNSKESIAYFTSGMEALIAEQEDQAAKLEFMQYQFKRLLHLPVMPGIIYDKKYPGIKSYFTNWLKREIDYFQLKMHGVTPLVESLPVHKEKQVNSEVTVGLSADQIGLIFRSAKDLEILEAKSFDAVLKKIVPAVSTKKQETLSWQSIRSKAFSGEARDKKIAADALRRMASKIDGY